MFFKLENHIHNEISGLRAKAAIFMLHAFVCMHACVTGSSKDHTSKLLELSLTFWVSLSSNLRLI
jgi:hypothetical protein